MAVLFTGMLAGTETRGADDDEIPAWRGRWDTEAELTIEPRTDASVAVAAGTPDGTVVWGGVAEDGRLLNDGVLIDSADPYHWRVMPESPLVPRRDYGWASVGDRVLIWGGVDEDGRPLDDGALFQHGWISLPRSRLPGGPASMAVVDYRLWVVATDPDTGMAQIQSMGVGIEDGASWGLVADVPLPAGARYEVVGCCGDEANELIVFTYTVPIGGVPLWRTNASTCYYQGKQGSWTLRGDPRARPRVWMQQDARTEPLRLPDGWHARFGPRLSITDPTGAVRFRGGETCEGNTGTGG